MGFDTLSEETLPRLSSLVCPPNMLDCFSDIVLNQLKVEWWDESLCSLVFPSTDLVAYGPGGFNLKPYRDSLETLEIRPMSIEFTDLPDPLEFPSLRCLHLWPGTSHWHISYYFFWITFPQTTRIRISAPERKNPPEFHGSFPVNTTDIQRVVGTVVDRVVIHQPPHRKFAKGYHIQCFAGDVERLRMDNYNITAKGLLAVFGSGNVPVTHLTLSSESGNLVVDLRAFPRLEHLTVCGRDMETLLSMLDSPSLCPSLVELVITCELAAGPTPAAKRATPSRHGRDVGADVGVQVDAVFQQKCAALRTVLARRAANGCHSRLTSLVLCLRPASASVPKLSKGGHPEDQSATADSDTMVWPSHDVRQSVLQTLWKLVDGPVVLKLIDRTGAEAAIDEAR